MFLSILQSVVWCERSTFYSKFVAVCRCCLYIHTYMYTHVCTYYTHARATLGKVEINKN
jgi:hypothetical protein